MNEADRNVLTERHLALFGAVTQWFARYELSIQQAIAGLLQTELSCIAILMRELDFMQKRMALLDLLRDRSAPHDQWERVFAHLALPVGQLPLRHHITHSTWINSPEPHSIQPNWILRPKPSVEPIYLGPTFDETSYTLEDLSEIVGNLAGGYERFVSYLAEAGLVPNQA